MNRVDELPRECDAHNRSTRFGGTRPASQNPQPASQNRLTKQRTSQIINRKEPHVTPPLCDFRWHHRRHDGKPDVTLSQCDGIAEGRATTHWGENRGSVEAVFLAIDIPK